MKRVAICLSVLVVLQGVGAYAQTASPRQRLLMDFGWRFTLKDPPEVGKKFDYPEVADLAKTSADYAEQDARLEPMRVDAAKVNLGSDVSYVQTGFDDSSWRKLDLPHDWKVELPFNERANVAEGGHALGEQWGTNIGWYRRSFDLAADDKGKDLWLEFDGVFRNALVWLNGHCLGRNLSGYASFAYDIAKFANFGGKNELVVRVDATRTEGWFYEGAGIYRHVWLVKTGSLHVAHSGTQVINDVTPGDAGNDSPTHIQTTLTNTTDQPMYCTLISSVQDADGKDVGQVRQDNIPVPAGEQRDVMQYVDLKNVKLWSIETPTMYKMISKVYQTAAPVAGRPGGGGGGRRGGGAAAPPSGPLVDQYETPFGIRTLAWDANKGFFLNGKHVEIQGTCNHQDHAGVGMALPDALINFRVEKLKELGCNAFRMSHNDPTPELLEACDRLGMLVMDEHREMATTPEILDQLRREVARDRNHPSIFLWSIGNEEYRIQGDSIVAPSIAKTMQDIVHTMDPTRLCTVPMSGGAGNGFTLVIDVQGFNYIHNSPNFDTFHKQWPTKLSIGTEEASSMSTRGVYTNDFANSLVESYDTQAPSWATTAEVFWARYMECPFIAGGFVWTGFDYRGEPTLPGGKNGPWPAVSSQFGILDTCGFPKDTSFYYQANWTDKPMVHVLPSWNWAGSENKTLPVWAYSNCEEVELFLNGKSLGKSKVDRLHHEEWQVPYQPGKLECVGYVGGKEVARDVVETTGAVAGIKLIPDRATIDANGQDVSVVTVEAVDAQGRVVPTADPLVKFVCTGGKIIGVGNGNPNSLESDKEPQRKSFHGLAQIIIQSTTAAGPIVLSANSDGLKDGQVTIDGKQSPLTPSVP
jgi:beta-galactosidase